MRPDQIGGTDSTYATLSVWDEAGFRYDEVVVVARQEDARAEFAALHDPPMVYVRAIRYGTRRLADYPGGRPYGMQTPGKVAG